MAGETAGRVRQSSESGTVDCARRGESGADHARRGASGADCVRRDEPMSADCVRLRFSGRGLGPNFLEFVADRAGRFSLDGWAAAGSDDSATVVVAGPPALIDMLEVACLLGPVDCVVDDVATGPADRADAGRGFRVLAPDGAARPATDRTRERAA